MNIPDLVNSSIEGSSLVAFLAVYAGGFLVSLTPCVYPVLPITVAYIGGQSGGSKLKGFLLSLFYVLGMAAAYTFLGGFAALTGKLFGQIQANPWTYFAVANVFIIFGLSMLDVFNIPLPAFMNRLQPKEAKSGYFGAFIVGLASGFIIGPCTAPVLGVLLGYIASKQNVIYGMSLLFVFALGMGTLFLVVGAFTGFLANLPRSGGWMVAVKKAFGFIMIAAGEYFLVTAGKMFV